jgi:YHS domain-containing protein
MNIKINKAPGGVLVSGKPAPGLAVHGYDVVSYVTDGKPLQGTADFSVIHNDATYRFASKSNLATFEANPDRYVPGYGGFCAYGVSVGALFDGDPRYWKIVDGKLYLNLDQGIAEAFNKDVQDALRKAEANWPKL